MTLELSRNRRDFLQQMFTASARDERQKTHHSLSKQGLLTRTNRVQTKILRTGPENNFSIYNTAKE